MKLSEVKGERVFDVLADVVEPIMAIASDEQASKVFTREELPEGMTPREFVMRKWTEALPVLMRDHRRDIVAIITTISGEDPDEFMESLTIPKLLKEVSDLLNDPEFMGFFA